MLGAAVFLGIVIRSDFVVVAGGLVAWLALRRPSRRPLRLAAGIGAVTVLTTAATVAFRLAYYGDPVPNTYFLKLAGFALGARLDRGLVVTAVTVAGYLAAPLVVIALGRRRLGPVGQDGARLLGLLAGLSALYGVSAGGDAWEYFLIPNRYLTPSLVLLLVLAVAVLRAGPSTVTVTVARAARPRLGRGVGRLRSGRGLPDRARGAAPGSVAGRAGPRRDLAGRGPARADRGPRRRALAVAVGGRPAIGSASSWSPS